MNIHHSPPFLSAAMAVAAPLNNPRSLLRPMKLAKSPSFSSSRPVVCFCSSRTRTAFRSLNATSTGTSLTDETSDSSADVFFNDTFPLKRPQKVEGKIFVSLNQLELTVGCNLPGKWILHWGVSYVDAVSGSGWDQPPKEMMPPGSVPIKDYAVDTPLVKSSEVDALYQVKIKFKPTCRIAAIHFLLKDEETGSWYQCRGKDFKLSLVDCLQNDGNLVEEGRGFELWPGSLGKLSNIVLKPEASPLNDQEGSMISIESEIGNRKLKGFYEELPVTKEVFVGNLVTVSAKKCSETARSILTLETDIPGDVIVHWGVCKDGSKRWEIPAVALPLETTVFKNKALHTRLQPKCDGNGSRGLFTLDGEYDGFLFMLKVDGDSWLKWRGNDFYIPLSVCSSRNQSDSTQVSGGTAEENEEFYSTAYTDGMISGIRNLISGFSSENSAKIKKKEAQESILQEIEKLAAEAYRFFRGSVPSVTPKTVSETEAPESSPRICSGTGTGFEIMCQCFNWESHKSGGWYTELKEKASEIASLGFTVVWLPPPTDSVSPEGYMPRDLYNLNSRYGSLDELKGLVKRLHEVGLKVLGDAVLNHRCAQYQNQNGVWNIFGGRLNWDDRAVVQDDPHFQGRGNKSSGDSFHAAPNIDHSQEFVRKDLKEWLCWLRKEVGYDGWRLDFVRGFWGGYVKDYMEASEPCFAVGEYWDSLSYTYSDMDYNQDAHRQRIIDWINGTGGMAGAFDVTTKGILHTALERCEYWRLSDEKGEPPGVVGWWPSRAVTFIENHDTGSTQGHWRFPKGKEMQGYAYILTHPGTPAVFYDHLFSPYRSQIGALISLRNRNKIHCRSTIKIVKVERDVYAAIINEKVAMKIGAGKYEPAKGPQSWSPAVEGHDYKVWESC